MSNRQERAQSASRRLWTLKETADYLGLPVGTMYQLNYKGTGPRFYTVGRHCRYEPDDVVAWLGERASDRRMRM